MLNDEFNQSKAAPKEYLCQMYGQDYYPLSDLVSKARHVLKQYFAISNLSLSEGVILRRCVEKAAAIRQDQLLKGSADRWSKLKAHEEACYLFFEEAYGIDSKDLDRVRFNRRETEAFAFLTVLWIELLRNKALSDGLDRQPIFDKHITYEMKNKPILSL